ncbi:MAG: hypothetical protein HXX20_20275 [Chloroflexi bacterium]|nr:hypothetical protein [Chloroflexota bacterium]
MNISDYNAKKDVTNRTTRSQTTPAGSLRSSPQAQKTSPITLTTEAQVAPSGEATNEEGKKKHFQGWRREVSYAVKYKDTKELTSLIANPNVTEEMVIKEFRKIFKDAIHRATAGGLLGVLKFYNAAINSTEDKGKTLPPFAPFLRNRLGNLPERAQKKVERLERWHQKLLDEWQEELHVKTPKGYVRKEKVVDVYRRHKIHIFFLSTPPIILFIVNLILFLIFLNLIPSLLLINAMVLVLVLGWVGWAINDWSNDYLLITDKRVLQMEKVTYFKLDKKEIPIDKAEQVTYVANRSLIDLMFRIGTVTVTGAGYAKLVFDRVYLPDRIRKEISDAKAAYMGSRAAFRSELMEKRIRNKLLGENHEETTGEPIQVDYIVRNEQSWWHLIVPSKPILDKDEKGMEQLTFRRHPLFLYRDLFKVVVFLLTLVVVALLALPRLFSLGNVGISLTGFIVTLLVFMIAIFWLWYTWEDWHNDRYIINNRDIIDIEKKPFGFDEEKSVIGLLKVQDIQSEKPNIFANLFNYGNVKVTTAGAGKPIIFSRVSDPDKVQAEFSRRMIMAKEFIEELGDKLVFNYLMSYSKALPDLNKKMGLEVMFKEIDDLKDRLKQLEDKE